MRVYQYCPMENTGPVESRAAREIRIDQSKSDRRRTNRMGYGQRAFWPVKSDEIKVRVFGAYRKYRGTGIELEEPDRFVNFCRNIVRLLVKKKKCITIYRHVKNRKSPGTYSPARKRNRKFHLNPFDDTHTYPHVTTIDAYYYVLVLLSVFV